ncbi:unnamed protein product [Urochloa decumbens]|uniref:Protein kinase domain-containing protein n=1 Tax=Urochloa decumbens TaxID=240449 RepID=A0ABC9B9N7_9POAL
MDCEVSKLNLLECMLLDETSEPTDLPISLLKTITDDFSDDLQIGRGGFSVVYKGFVGNGRTVAVKKLSNSIDIDETKYNQEVGCLMTIRHKNIVRFLGYCANTHGKILDHEGKLVMADVRHRLLCFEYLCNGSLRDYITDASHGLEWTSRYKILKGICNGLCHLHEAHIVHLDLKPANILLDDNMVPKISDFGLSRRFDGNQTRTITSQLYGSLGYLAPEFHSGLITFKSDIYSLGVIFTEIMTGQKGYSPVDHVLQNWKNRLDMSSAESLLEQVRVCAQISIDCMNIDSEKRPVIQCIIQSLDDTEKTDQLIRSVMSTSLTPQGQIQAHTLVYRKHDRGSPSNIIKLKRRLDMFHIMLFSFSSTKPLSGYNSI